MLIWIGVGTKVILPRNKIQIMKTILTIIAVTFFGTMAMAQDISKEAKVEVITADVVLDMDFQQTIRKDRKTARLYKFKNSRVKQALSFSTKKNTSKLA